MTDDFLDGKLECLFPGVLLGLGDGIKLGPREGIGIDKSLGVLDGLLPGKYDGIEIVYSECSTDGNTYGKFEVLALGD